MTPTSGSQFLLSWLPFLVLIAAWIVFMVYFRMSPSLVNRRPWLGQTSQQLQRIIELLEQIAKHLDRK